MLSGLHLSNQRIGSADYETLRLMNAKACKLWAAVHNPADADALRRAFPGMALVVRTTDLPLPFPNYAASVTERLFVEIGSFYHAGARYFQVWNELNTDPRFNPWTTQFYARLILLELRRRLDLAAMKDALLISPPLSWSPGLWRRSESNPYELDEWLAAYAYTGGGKVPSLLDCFNLVGANCYFQNERQLADPSFGGSFERLQLMAGGKSVVLCEYGLSPSQNQTPQQLGALRVQLYPAYLKWLQQYDIHSAHAFISKGGTPDWEGFYVSDTVARAMARVSG